MTDETKALQMLAASSKSQVPRPAAVYDFEQLGSHLADVMITAADDMMTEAHKLADHTRKMAVEIRLTVDEQSKALNDINNRLKATGEQMLEAHRKFNGS